MTAFLADIHGNSAALRAVLQDARVLGAGRFVVLGDVINGPDPRGCLEILLEISGIRFLKGNAEAYLCTDRLEDFPLRGEPKYASLLDKLFWWRSAIGRELLDAVWSWPDEWDEDGVLCVHDSPRDRLSVTGAAPHLDPRYRELMFHGPGIGARLSDSEIGEAVAPARERGFRRVACGHTHEAFLRAAGDVTVCNAGSVGMPLDGDPRPAWALREDGVFRIRRVPYDVEEAVALVRASGMPLEGKERLYEERLRLGRFQ